MVYNRHGHSTRQSQDSLGAALSIKGEASLHDVHDESKFKPISMTISQTLHEHEH